jgi:hypothetical protein
MSPSRITRGYSRSPSSSFLVWIPGVYARHSCITSCTQATLGTVEARRLWTPLAPGEPRQTRASLVMGDLRQVRAPSTTGESRRMRASQDACAASHGHHRLQASLARCEHCPQVELRRHGRRPPRMSLDMREIRSQ